MSSVSTPVSNPPKTTKTKITENVTRVAIATSFGYLVGRIITSINPMCAAIFTLVASTIQLISNAFFKKSHHFDNICFGTVFVSLTTGYIVANYFAKFTMLHALSIFSLGVISVVALGIIIDRI
ncbi:MAG: hypothetical protein KR126chlam4_00536 [Candidatus Anoxychlamydiales bacterium]|uniref:Uncharacterized protein n=1 Tax=marine sediment metagenome TaxID=412755 RepID=A0A0F9MH69_9ZZZZ|nr:hypothetical protein [Candidatus Anoxychlamydiales bacterium]NGX40708.1 hypothetical protein [Candidatus Anoxychlamydiales bacterium]HEU64913.1 hypothetical protein [Chlamydiota bacterium]